MGFRLRRWSDSTIVVVQGFGTGSVAEHEVHLAAITEEAARARATGVLFDLRLLDFVPMGEEAREIASRCGRFGVRQGLRRAYRAPPGAQYGVARMVQMLCETEGAVAAAFISVDAAIAWLSSDVSAMGA